MAPLDNGSAVAETYTYTYTTHNTHKRQISMPLAGFESAIPACERLQTHALDSTVTGIDSSVI
jgi:hypothetical protein